MQWGEWGEMEGLLDIGRKVRRKETTKEAKTYMGG
jgi:hypothetical protein